MRGWAVLALALASLSQCSAGPHFDSTNRIGILAVGDTSYGESPILGWLSLDFSIQYQELPTNVEGVMSDVDARKLVRIYTPRTLERLLETYDILLMLEPRMWFSNREIRMFVDSIDLGMSTILTMWINDNGYLSLVQTELPAVYPQVFAPLFEPSDNLPYVVELEEGVPPVLTPFLGLGAERFTGSRARPINPKQGSTVWARAVKFGAGSTRTDEYIISWEYGDGEAMNWVFGSDFDESWFTVAGGNQYGADMVLNILYHTAGKPLPPGVEIVHNLRASFYRYSIEKKLLFGVIDFIDKFGVSTTGLEGGIARADEGRYDAERLFLEGDYEASYGRIREMVEELSNLNEGAIRAKDRALFWVYATEWSIVTGTALLAGFLLHTLMVRRRLYRPMGQTRLGR
jgi:hypothetical protein